MRKIQMMGIDHSRATVAERELFSLTKAKQKELMEAVIRQQGVGGCVLLSTCNRTELYVSLQKKRILICTGFSVISGRSRRQRRMNCSICFAGGAGRMQYVTSSC